MVSFQLVGFHNLIGWLTTLVMGSAREAEQRVDVPSIRLKRSVSEPGDYLNLRVIPSDKRVLLTNQNWEDSGNGRDVTDLRLSVLGAPRSRGSSQSARD